MCDRQFEIGPRISSTIIIRLISPEIKHQLLKIDFPPNICWPLAWTLLGDCPTCLNKNPDFGLGLHLIFSHSSLSDTTLTHPTTSTHLLLSGMTYWASSDHAGLLGLPIQAFTQRQISWSCLAHHHELWRHKKLCNTSCFDCQESASEGVGHSAYPPKGQMSPQLLSLRKKHAIV